MCLSSPQHHNATDFTLTKVVASKMCSLSTPNNSLLIPPAKGDDGNWQKQESPSFVSNEVKTSKRRPKNVTFAKESEETDQVRVDIAGLVQSLSEISHDDRRSLWWQQSDYNTFKNTMSMIGQEIRLVDSYGDCLVKVLEACSSLCEDKENSCPLLRNDRNLSSEKESRGHVDSLNEKNGSPLFRDLVRWNKYGHSRRGLELLSSFKYKKRMRGMKDASIQAVLEEQNRQREQRPRSNSEDIPTSEQSNDWDERANSLRLISERCTRPAKEFARAMGAADAEATKSRSSKPRKNRLNRRMRPVSINGEMFLRQPWMQ